MSIHTLSLYHYDNFIFSAFLFSLIYRVKDLIEVMWLYEAESNYKARNLYLSVSAVHQIYFKLSGCIA